MKNKRLMDWILRFIKGVFIGSGAILPGVSGGALAAIFGIYERIISFIANITKDFKKNVLFFIPVGLGGLFGIFMLSFVISFFFEKSEVQIIWFFIGCIVGTIPALINEAGKKGRKPKHIVISITTFMIALFFLFQAENLITGTIELNFVTWILLGALIGLGFIVPGLSPSNFLVYLNAYKPMTDGIKNLDFMIIIPIGIGVLVTVFALSKVMDFIFSKAYAGLFHFILGIVFASTIMIVPTNFNYLSLGTVVCALACFGGIVLGAWMSRLEEKYKLD